MKQIDEYIIIINEDIEERMSRRGGTYISYDVDIKRLPQHGYFNMEFTFFLHKDNKKEVLLTSDSRFNLFEDLDKQMQMIFKLVKKSLFNNFISTEPYL